MIVSELNWPDLGDWDLYRTTLSVVIFIPSELNWPDLGDWDLPLTPHLWKEQSNIRIELTRLRGLRHCFSVPFCLLHSFIRIELTRLRGLRRKIIVAINNDCIFPSELNWPDLGDWDSSPYFSLSIFFKSELNWPDLGDWDQKSDCKSGYHQKVSELNWPDLGDWDIYWLAECHCEVIFIRIELTRLRGLRLFLLFSISPTQVEIRIELTRLRGLRHGIIAHSLSSK